VLPQECAALNLCFLLYKTFRAAAATLLKHFLCDLKRSRSAGRGAKEGREEVIGAKLNDHYCKIVLIQLLHQEAGAWKKVKFPRPRSISTQKR
jgi:hypothetical protein